mmetsp:Transcript_152965/g.281949  ORF Transcript_152965/g.281949 Transcript_152965/m.281949 type:complete len:181 (+) Transcript_152965:84-626(+)
MGFGSCYKTCTNGDPCHCRFGLANYKSPWFWNRRGTWSSCPCMSCFCIDMNILELPITEPCTIGRCKCCICRYTWQEFCPGFVCCGLLFRDWRKTPCCETGEGPIECDVKCLCQMCECQAPSLDIGLGCCGGWCIGGSRGKDRLQFRKEAPFCAWYTPFFELMLPEPEAKPLLPPSQEKM